MNNCWLIDKTNYIMSVSTD